MRTNSAAEPTNRVMPRSTRALLNRFACRGGLWLQFDLAEGSFILADVLIQHIRQRFSLLRAQEYSLIIRDGNVIRRSLINCPEQEKEVPQADTHLHAVGVRLAVIRGVRKLNLGWWRLGIHSCPIFNASSKKA